MDLAGLRRALEHAPLVGYPTGPDDLVGWRLEDETCVCARCWSRVLARGCGSSAVDPIWDAWPAGARCGGCDR